ncbi:MAG: hypothetical protein ACXW0L_04470 [Methylosarcina sp.]
MQQWIWDSLANVLIAFLSYAVFTMISLPAYSADIIVNRTVPVSRYTLDDARAIFSMRKKYWPNGKPIHVFALPDGNRTHQDFVKHKLLMFPHQLRRTWDRMIYAGIGETPLQLDSEREMIEKIANTPDSIGYIENRPENEKIRLFEYR